ncbi:MAG: T9SS type A sorting domain-containing protein [Bacteroidota bacterium]|nr:T9SS type A sorting domain-containing protein [Bacteroidota bacterium]
MKTLKKILKPDKLLSLLFYLSILVFIIAFNFSDHGSGGWQQQSIPFLNNRSLADITFLDSLTGYAVTGDNIAGSDTDYVLKTTNSGYNWNIVLSKARDFSKVMFLNLDTGYVLHGDEILRTTNAGTNWNNIPVPPGNFGFYDMYPINYDTMWICFPYIGGDFIYRTTNAGFSWVRQLQSFAIEKIYMYDGNLGFTSGVNVNNFYKTTNSGINWIGVAGNDFVDIYFIDSLTGWKAKGDMKKTTDGGNTWIEQPIPNGPNFTFSSMEAFSNVNQDTIWGSGGLIRLGNQRRGILYRTTNGGNNWAYQIPDTTIHSIEYLFNSFINKNNGWFYTIIKNGIYTTIGGDTNFITTINSNTYLNPDDYKLSQNFPNPFNPKTIIKYEIKKQSQVTIKVFSILGVEIETLIESKQQPGSHKIEFDGSNIPSGVYFYGLSIDGIPVDTKKMILIR